MPMCNFFTESTAIYYQHDTKTVFIAIGPVLCEDCNIQSHESQMWDLRQSCHMTSLGKN